MTIAVKRVAINTGGDAPGLNAVIHGAVYAARGRREYRRFASPDRRF